MHGGRDRGGRVGSAARCVPHATRWRASTTPQAQPKLRTSPSAGDYHARHPSARQQPQCDGRHAQRREHSTGTGMRPMRRSSSIIAHRIAQSSPIVAAPSLARCCCRELALFPIPRPAPLLHAAVCLSAQLRWLMPVKQIRNRSAKHADRDATASDTHRGASRSPSVGCRRLRCCISPRPRDGLLRLHLPVASRGSPKPGMHRSITLRTAQSGGEGRIRKGLCSSGAAEGLRTLLSRRIGRACPLTSRFL